MSTIKGDRTSWELGGHFLCVKIFHAMSNMPKPTVASSVSRAKVSKSVMKHPPFRIKRRGCIKIVCLPDARPER